MSKYILLTVYLRRKNTFFSRYVLALRRIMFSQVTNVHAQKFKSEMSIERKNILL